MGHCLRKCVDRLRFTAQKYPMLMSTVTSNAEAMPTITLIYGAYIRLCNTEYRDRVYIGAARTLAFLHLRIINDGLGAEN